MQVEKDASQLYMSYVCWLLTWRTDTPIPRRPTLPPSGLYCDISDTCISEFLMNTQAIFPLCEKNKSSHGFYHHSYIHVHVALMFWVFSVISLLTVYCLFSQFLSCYYFLFNIVLFLCYYTLVFNFAPQKAERKI